MVGTSRCFAFRALIRQAQIWKRSRVENSTSLLYLPIPSSVETWKISPKHALSIFFAIFFDISSEKIPYFRKPLFCKTRTDYASKTLCCVHDFTTGENFSFNQRHNKEFCVFVSRKLIYKTNRKLFSCICIAWYKHSKGWENSRQLWKRSTSPRICI